MIKIIIKGLFKPWHLEYPGDMSNKPDFFSDEIPFSDRV